MVDDLRSMLMECVVLTDFDGTMVTIDTAQYVLDKFADKNWQFIDEQLERGEVTFEESLTREFAMLRIPENTMLEALKPVTHFRPNFDKLIHYCKGEGFPIIVVSGGLDFSIRHFLGQKGWLGSVEIYSPKAQCTENGVILSFPDRFDQNSTNFKDDMVRYHRKKGNRVVYVGNGLGDYPAAKIADLPLAVKGSRLAQLCRIGHVACTEITDFEEAVESIRRWLSVTKRDT
jgi:2,3-diketo-5-methylthio-1-phosphopentane phosphatase